MNIRMLIVLVSVVLLSVVGLRGQTNVPAFGNYSWNQAGMKAIEEKKIVLVAVGISPGDPKFRKLIADENLRLAMNRSVVGMNMDMESEVGKAFEPKLLLHRWPVFAFLMPFGDLLLTVEPEEAYRNPQRLVDAIGQAQYMADVKRKNSRSIRFVSQEPEVSDRADRPVFLYGYDRSRQPSLLMERNVFNLDSVADFYNKNFICIQTDTIRSADTPVYRFVHENGKLITQAEGLKNEQEMLRLGREVLKRLEGIAFEEYELAVTDENARIFVDCYALNKNDNLIPERKQYKDPELSAYLEEHFINKRLNVNSETGLSLKKHYLKEVTPFVLFLDASGEPLHWLAGETDADGIRQEAERVLKGRGLMTLVELYKQEKNEVVFIEEYLQVLTKAGWIADATEVVAEFFRDRNPELLKEKRYWELFYRYAEDANSEMFGYVWTNRSFFYNLYGKNAVDAKMTEVWKKGADAFLKQENGVYIFDRQGLNDYRKRLKKEKVTGWQEMIRNARLLAAEKTGDWNTFVELVEEKWKERAFSEGELYTWGEKINAYCKNDALRYRAARWFALELENIEKLEKRTGRVNYTVYKGYYKQLVGDLLRESARG